MRIKNWHKFQHFKDRRPIWIKLYRELLDDLEWHELDPLAAKVLTMLWLIGSEDEGRLPDMKKLSFRLRMSEKQIISTTSQLSHWLEQDDINAISNGYQLDMPEKRREEKNISSKNDFELFWKTFPRREGKGQAEKAYAHALHAGVLPSTIQNSAAQYAQAKAMTEKQFIRLPATWLNGKGWEDEIISKNVDDDASRWKLRVTHWQAKKFWLSEWGDDPSSINCQCPKEILKEFGVAA